MSAPARNGGSVAAPLLGLVLAGGRSTRMRTDKAALLYGGRAQLFVSSGAKEAKTLAENLPSLKSRDYGKPFADIFAAVKGDFYAIDRMLFSPAMVTVMMSSISLRLRLSKSSFGKYIVEPSAWPRGMIVTLWRGCVCLSRTFTSACPASCQAVSRFSSSLIAVHSL